MSGEAAEHARAQDVHAAVRASLPHARWEYDDDADEVDIIFPNSEGREGRAVLVRGELYVRLDVDTGQPLSIIIPSFRSWWRQYHTPSRWPKPRDIFQSLYSRYSRSARGPLLAETSSEGPATRNAIVGRVVLETLRYSRELTAAD